MTFKEVEEGERRAHKLLMSHLTPAQREDWSTERHPRRGPVPPFPGFNVRCPSGRVWRVINQYFLFGNGVTLVDPRNVGRAVFLKDGKHLDENRYPKEDHALALMLMLTQGGMMTREGSVEANWETGEDYLNILGCRAAVASSWHPDYKATVELYRRYGETELIPKKLQAVTEPRDTLQAPDGWF